ncbi:MAG TPA: carboxypeptidase regulatory-like domain-containing protein [Terriglobales bacterium]|nr:carboxypeptidase regulatory-like domain-containing protein [Terriglobales bacterium]
MRTLTASLMVVLFLVGTMAAQGGATGAITGTVMDSTGAVVPNAEIKIISKATGEVTRTTRTDTAGVFNALLMPVGTYDVQVNAPGFGQVIVQNLAVRVTETTRMYAKLTPQKVTEQVEVEAEVQTVETSNATTGESIESRTIRTIPLATQNFQQLLSLSAGTASELNASAQLGRGDVRIIVNGQREDNNNYLVEGITATDYNVAELTNTPLPNPDVVQEFKVQTSLYDASQGRNSGGNVNAILKSGTKEFHGDVYEFFRNDVLNANEFFLKRDGQPRPVVRQNIFGGSLGGPVLPGGKLGFFFINYQGTRQRSGLSPGTFISTLLPVLPVDRSEQSLLNAFFPGKSGLHIDPVALKLLNFKSNQFGNTPGGYLLPSVPGVPGLTNGSLNTGPFAISRPGKFNDDQFTTNWDREFRGGNDKIAVRFFFSDSEQQVPFGAGGLQASLGGSVSGSDLNFPFDLPVSDRLFTISETHIFSPTLVNDFRFGLVHINNSAINVPPVTVGDVGINRPTNNLTQSIYKFTLLSSGFQLGPTPQADQFQDQNNFDFIETLSWTHGKHAFRFGGEFTRVNLDKKFPQTFNGQLFFTNTNGGLNDFQKFLLGAPDFSFGGGGLYTHQYRQNNYAVFAQDDWRIRPDLTLNLGLRTEFFGAFTDGKCSIGNLESSLTKQGLYPFVYPGCVNKFNIPGFTGNADPSTFNNSVSTTLGPRIGFAWDILGHHTTTLRGGYGIYYVREDVGNIDQLSFQAPLLPIAFGGNGPGSLGNFFSGTLATNPNALPPAGVLSPAYVPCLSVLTGFQNNNPNLAPNYVNANGCNGVPSVGIFGLEVPRRFVVPSTQQWNMSLERDLGHNFVAEIGYVGSHSIHLRETRDAIQSVNATPQNPFFVTTASGVVIPITANTLANGIARTPTPGLNGYSGYQIFANDAYSHYHALQLSLKRRWSRGYLLAAYTFARSTDATSTGNTAFNTAYNDQSNINASRGLSDFDRTHRVAISYVYDLPFAQHATGFEGAALGGWGVSGVTIFQSGTPFSIIDSGAATAFLGAGSTPLLGAALAPGASLSQGLSRGDIFNRINGYLNPAAFTTAPLLYPGQCAVDPNFCVTGFGNLGRNIYRGPFQQNFDFSLIKNFRITERQGLRFTADFFNLFNHPNFASPAFTDVESPSNFGQITNTKGTPRLIQFSLRYAF